MTYNKMTTRMALNLTAPHTWAASIGPSVFGCVYCFLKGYALSIWQALLLIIASILMQSSVNCLNDYIDYIKGSDSKEDTLERNDAVLVYENINPKSALAIGIICLAMAIAIGVVLMLSCRCIIPLYIGIVAVLCIVFYSGGRTPISYLPIGEFVSGFVMGGLIPLGCAAVADQTWHFEVILFALPYIISIGMIMLSNNGCDIEKDIEANRKTLPVLLGREKSRKLYKTLTIVWILSLWVLPIILIGWPGLACALLSHFIARPIMLFLMNSPLDQQHRINQMKSIVKANYLANGCYVITLIIGIMIEYLKA